MKELLDITCVSTHTGRTDEYRKKYNVPRKTIYTIDEIRECDNKLLKKLNKHPICQQLTKNLYFDKEAFRKQGHLCDFADTPEYDKGYTKAHMKGWFELYNLVTDIIVECRCVKNQDLGFFAEYTTYILVRFNSGHTIKFYNGYWFYG